jgi:hypothetical protein
MQNTFQQSPEYRMRLPQIREVTKDYSGELLISCLDLSRVGYLQPGYALLSGRQSVAKLRRRRLSLTRRWLAHACMAGCFI